MWNCLKSFTFILDVIIFLNVEVRLAIESIELTGDEKANRTREEEKKKEQETHTPRRASLDEAQIVHFAFECKCKFINAPNSKVDRADVLLIACPISSLEHIRDCIRISVSQRSVACSKIHMMVHLLLIVKRCFGNEGSWTHSTL